MNGKNEGIPNNSPTTIAALPFKVFDYLFQFVLVRLPSRSAVLRGAPMAVISRRESDNARLIVTYVALYVNWLL